MPLGKRCDGPWIVEPMDVTASAGAILSLSRAADWPAPPCARTANAGNRQAKGVALMDVYETVRQFILQNIVRAEDSLDLREHTRLDELGILDSLSTLRLLSFLEEEFRVDFELTDIEEGGFTSLASIERLIRAKTATGA
jgi:acyl carrier protein